MNQVPLFFSRFPLLWIILPHCKLFLWSEPIVEPTLDRSNTSVVQEVDSLVADGHHRYSSVVDGYQKHVDRGFVLSSSIDGILPCGLIFSKRKL